MPPTATLLPFALSALALIVVPGPSVLFVISRGVALGRRAALLTVAGNAAGFYVYVVLVALGLGRVVERSAPLFTGLKLAGAAYLVVLGVQAIRQRRSLAAALGGTVEARHDRRLLREGFLVGVANPKAILFLAAVLPQFVDRDAGPVALQLWVLGSVFTVLALVCDSAWGLVAGSAREALSSSPQRLERLGGAGGLVMIALGARLAVTGRPSTS
jgi:threonine/homoserine/homoserine lactone efflux protein